MNNFKIKSRVWKWPGNINVYFVSLDKKISKKIKDKYIKKAYGSGFIKIRVCIKKQTYETALFPFSKESIYLIPINKKIRTGLGIYDQDFINLVFEII